VPNPNLALVDRLRGEKDSNHTFTHPYPRETEYFDLCPKCYDKRTTESTGECEDCGRTSEEVTTRHIEHQHEADEYFDLCEKCYEKRSKETEIETRDQKDPSEAIEAPTSKSDVRAMLQSAGLMLKILKGFPEDQRIAKLEALLAEKSEVAPGMEPAYEAYRALLQAELDQLGGQN